MANSLLENIKKEQTKKLTENYASAYNTSNNFLVDLFGIAGSLRYRDADDIENMFSKAFSTDELLSSKLAFYTRDIRGGLGERETARTMFLALARIRPEILKKNLKYIPEFGRWDDLLIFLDTSLRNDVIEIIKNQLLEDIKAVNEGKAISLLSKWLPSINTSSNDTRKKAYELADALNMSYKEYRKTLSLLRSYLNVTEVRLSSKDYDYIKYEQVPSLAMNKYRYAFEKNDKEKFNNYLTSLKNGETKINASTLYPYNIVEKYLHGQREVEEILEEQWKALPNYVEGENNFLIMADTSGSMNGRPLATSVGLAIYFAERNKGAFANKFMTFSELPELVELKGETLLEKILNAKNAHWENNTNLEKAFDLVLQTALKYKTPKEEMPSSIVIISDMEIDICTNTNHWGFYDEMKERFEKSGYEIPNIVFWNVNARANTFHADSNTKGVQLASGQSPSVFECLIKGVDLTPYDFMVKTLSSPRYDCIKI